MREVYSKRVRHHGRGAKGYGGAPFWAFPLHGDLTMATYKAKCGIHFKNDCCGSSFYLGERWGEDYGKETVWCPKTDKSICPFHKAFTEKFSLIGDCEGVLIPEKEYDYENSVEKIKDDYSRQSYEKIVDRFGSNCMAISPDGVGGYTVKRDEMNCKNCWNSICVVTNKERDMTKVRVMGDVETIWTETIGFLKEEHKRLDRKKVIKDLVPLEFAERLLKDPKNVLFQMFITNNCERAGQKLGIEAPSRVIRFYWEKSTAKRDFLADLKAVEEGYVVSHEIDSEKDRKARKKAERAEKKQKKEKRLRKRIKGHQMQQLSLFD